MHSKTLSFCIILTFCCWKSIICAKTPECCSYRRSETSYCDGHSVSLINISMPANSLKRLEFKKNGGKDISLNNSLDKYTKLEILYLKGNGIKHIPANLFRNNHNLKEINLGDNEIEDIPPNLFNDVSRLEILWLDNNKLKNISENVFRNNVELKALIINHNHISTFTTNFFEPISKLKTLKVDNNNLKFFNPEYFTKIRSLSIFYTSGISDCCSAEARLPDLQCLLISSKTEECGIKLEGTAEADPHIGRVEINDKGNWKTICDKQWTKENAITVCRELGHDGSAEPILPNYVQNGNTKAIFLNQTLNCKGHEYSTLQCDRENQTDAERQGCSHSTDVGVRCQAEEEKQVCSVSDHDCGPCQNSTIDCSKKGLKYTPWIEKDKSENITEFDLSGNSIRWIFEDYLRTFSKLEKIDFSSNNIKEIPETLLSDCKALKEINFASNEIAAIPVKLLHNLRQLNKLDLSSNKLTKLPENLFRDTENLDQLILKGNQFRTLFAKYFIGLKSLKFLDVSNMPNTLVGEINWPPIFDNLEQLTKLKTSYFSHCCFVALVRQLECIAPADTFSSCERMLRADVLRYLMWVFVVLTFGGNIFALIMRLTETDENRVQNLLVSSLCVSDMLMGIYLAGIINKEMSTLGSYYQHDLEWRRSPACHAFGAFSVISSEVSVFTLVFIAYDRFLHVVRALDFKEINYATAVTLLVLTWTTCTIIAVIPSVIPSYFNDKIKNTGFYGTSSICLPLQLPGQGAIAWEYCLAIFGVLNFAAAIYLIVAYIRMFYSSYKSAREAGNATRINDHPKMATRFASIVFTDVCCWVPIAMLLFLSLGRAVTDNDNTLYAYFSICIIPINSAINPILYTVGTPFFWRKMKAYFKNNFRCCNRAGDEPIVPNTNLELKNPPKPGISKA